MEIKSLYKNFNKITKGIFGKDKIFQDNAIKFIKNYIKSECLFSKNDNGINTNTQKINSKTNLSNAFTLSSININVRKQYELEYDKDDKNKAKKKSKNKKDRISINSFFTGLTPKNNNFASSKINKHLYVNQNVNSMFKTNNSKLSRNNKFIEDYCESNYNNTINLNNDNSAIKLNNISEQNYNSTFKDCKEPGAIKKKKNKKKFKFLSDI